MVTATVLTLPAVKTVVVRRPDLKRREELLTSLARNADGYDDEELEVLLAAWASDGLSGHQLQLAWTDFVERLALLEEAMLGGGCDPLIVDGEVTWPSQDAQAALDVLTGREPMRWHA